MVSGVGEVARTAEALVILCPDMEEQSVGVGLMVRGWLERMARITNNDH